MTQVCADMPVSTRIVERTRGLGRQWLPSHHRIDAAPAITAAALRSQARLLTCNVHDFPVFPGLSAPN